jgi:glycosyltransferase involved in cell wall biosynthesis
MIAKRPKISVVMAAYNAAEALPRAIESFSLQTYPAKELIVIDGASTDNTGEILKSYERWIDFSLSEPDKGILDAWNKGLKRITGDWVYFQGADDYYFDENVFANMAGYLAAYEAHSKVIYGIVERVTKRGDFVEWHGLPWDRARFREVGMCIAHTATFHHRSLFDDYGEFDAHLPIGSPYEFLLRYLKDHDAIFVPRVIACMTIGGESNRPENLLAFVRHDRDAQRRHGTLNLNARMISRSVAYAKASTKFALSKIMPDVPYWWTLDMVRAMKGRRRMYGWRSLEKNSSRD